MAKRNGEVNKSQEVRDILDQNPRKPVREIIATLAAKGIKVQPSLIYMVRSKRRSQGPKQRRKHKAARMGRTPSSGVAALVIKVKSLASEAGGMGQLRELVNVLAE
jgi:hypothetical protein